MPCTDAYSFMPWFVACFFFPPPDITTIMYVCPTTRHTLRDACCCCKKNPRRSRLIAIGAPRVEWIEKTNLLVL